MREATNSPSESVEAYLKNFGMSLKNLQLEDKSFIDDSVEATLQTFYGVGLCDRFDNKDENFRDCVTLKKKRKITRIKLDDIHRICYFF